MLSRLHAQKIEAGEVKTLNIKLQAGGLMEVDYLSACILILCEQLQPEDYLLDYDRLIDKALYKFETGFYQSSSADRLVEVTQFWRRLQIWSRLLGLGES